MYCFRDKNSGKYVFYENYEYFLAELNEFPDASGCLISELNSDKWWSVRWTIPIGDLEQVEIVCEEIIYDDEENVISRDFYIHSFPEPDEILNLETGCRKIFYHVVK